MCFNMDWMPNKTVFSFLSLHQSVQRFSRAGPRGRGREWVTLGVHPLSWLLSNNRLEKVPVVSVPHTSSNRLLLSNQDKGCTPSVAHSLPLPLGPDLLNLSNVATLWRCAEQYSWFSTLHKGSGGLILPWKTFHCFKIFFLFCFVFCFFQGL